MLAIATEALIVIAMIVGFVGVLGAGNAVLFITTDGDARWYWHIGAWLACFTILVSAIYFGADTGMWCLSSDAAEPHMRCR